MTVRAENVLIARMLIYLGYADRVVVGDRVYGKKGLMITEKAANKKDRAVTRHWLIK